MAILRRRLAEKVPVSDLCDELGISLSKLYDWRKRYGKVNGTFYHICSIIDGYSRYVVHWRSAKRCSPAISAAVKSPVSRSR